MTSKGQISFLRYKNDGWNILNICDERKSFQLSWQVSITSDPVS